MLRCDLCITSRLSAFVVRMLGRRDANVREGAKEKILFFTQGLYKIDAVPSTESR
jgi:hypothetical protein